MALGSGQSEHRLLRHRPALAFGRQRRDHAVGEPGAAVRTCRSRRSPSRRRTTTVRIAGLRNGQVFATTTGREPARQRDHRRACPPESVGCESAPRGQPRCDPPDRSEHRLRRVRRLRRPGRTARLEDRPTSPAAPPSWFAAGTGIPDVPVNALAIDPDTSSRSCSPAPTSASSRPRDGGVVLAPFSPRAAARSRSSTSRYSDGAEPVLRAATHGRGIWEISTDALFLDGFESGDTAEPGA